MVSALVLIALPLLLINWLFPRFSQAFWTGFWSGLWSRVFMGSHGGGGGCLGLLVRIGVGLFLLAVVARACGR